MILAHQPSGSEIWIMLQTIVAGVENLTGRFGVQTLVNAKSRLQLQVCPVVQRIAEAVRHRSRPRLELLPVTRLAASDETLGDAVGAHSTPFVMIAAEPQFCDAAEMMVVSHLSRIQMAVIVDDGLWCRMPVIEFLRRGGLQEEILVHKRFHSSRFLAFYGTKIVKS